MALNLDGLVTHADVWVHGSYSLSYQIGQCRVVSNQRGYVSDGHAESTGFQDPSPANV
jgi:hypothetical protein